MQRNYTNITIEGKESNVHSIYSNVFVSDMKCVDVGIIIIISSSSSSPGQCGRRRGHRAAGGPEAGHLGYGRQRGHLQGEVPGTAVQSPDLPIPTERDKIYPGGGVVLCLERPESRCRCFCSRNVWTRVSDVWW